MQFAFSERRKVDGIFVIIFADARKIIYVFITCVE
jgi:hypothetical protein